MPRLRYNKYEVESNLDIPFVVVVPLHLVEVGVPHEENLDSAGLAPCNTLVAYPGVAVPKTMSSVSSFENSIRHQRTGTKSSGKCEDSPPQVLQRPWNRMRQQFSKRTVLSGILARFWKAISRVKL